MSTHYFRSPADLHRDLAHARCVIPLQVLRDRNRIPDPVALELERIQIANDRALIAALDPALSLVIEPGRAADLARRISVYHDNPRTLSWLIARAWTQVPSKGTP